VPEEFLPSDRGERDVIIIDFLRKCLLYNNFGLNDVFLSCWQKITHLKWQQTVVYVFLKVKYFDSHLRFIDFALLPNGISKSAQNTMVQNPVTHVAKLFSRNPLCKREWQEEQLETREGKCVLGVVGLKTTFIFIISVYSYAIIPSVLLNNNKSKLAELFVVILDLSKCALGFRLQFWL